MPPRHVRRIWASQRGGPTRTLSSARAELNDEWSDITAKLAKAAAEINRRQAEIATAREVVTKLETTLPIARQREADFRQLADQGFMSSHANQDRTRERIEMERDLATQSEVGGEPTPR